MKQFRPEVQTLFRLLEDDQWHPYRVISERLAATIAPGKALRKYEDRRERRRANAASEVTMPEPNEDEKILYGQRLIANQTINGVRERYLLYREVPHGREVRLKPDVKIPRTGTPLEPGEVDGEPEDGPEPDETPPEPEETAEGRVEAGEDFGAPGELTGSIDEVLSRFETCGECGLLIADQEMHQAWHDEQPPSESVMRALVAQEVGVQLDGFQSGFQLWLAGQLEEMKCPIAGLHQRP